MKKRKVYKSKYQKQKELNAVYTTRRFHVMLFCMNTLEELGIKKGKMKSDFMLSSEAKNIVKELIDSGFSPTEEEAKECVYEIVNDEQLNYELIEK